MDPVNKSLEEEIEALKLRAENHKLVLNNEAIWLFIATLGCWGVDNIYFRLAAFFLTLYLFGIRVISKKFDNRNIKELIEEIKSRINSSDLIEDYKKARLFDLENFKKSYMYTFPKRKDFGPFLVCWLFYSFSLGYLFFTFQSLQA